MYTNTEMCIPSHAQTHTAYYYKNIVYYRLGNTPPHSTIRMACATTNTELPSCVYICVHTIEFEVMFQWIPKCLTIRKLHDSRLCRVLSAIHHHQVSLKRRRRRLTARYLCNLYLLIVQKGRVGMYIVEQHRMDSQWALIPFNFDK